jgi:lauroyl/myristoyl acyltransferase
MTLLVKLARNNNAKVLMTWADRLDHGKGYELRVHAVILKRPFYSPLPYANLAADAKKVTRRFVFYFIFNMFI